MFAFPPAEGALSQLTTVQSPLSPCPLPQRSGHLQRQGTPRSVPCLSPPPATFSPLITLVGADLEAHARCLIYSLSDAWTERWVDGQMKGRQQGRKRRCLWVVGQMVGGVDKQSDDRYISTVGWMAGWAGS